MDLIVVGAGLAGLTVARAAQDAGLTVLVLEKSRGAGGRCATRRTEHGRFDHGAPVVHLDGADVVAQPRMSALGRERAEGLTVRTQARAATVRPGVVTLEDGEVLHADRIAVCTPAPQAVDLLADGAARTLAARADYDPCWTAMLALPERLEGAPDALDGAGPIRHAHREAARPGRDPEPERWVVQADAAWTTQRLDAEPATVADALLAELLDRTGAPAPTAPPLVHIAHRWLYATVRTPAGASHVLQDDGIGVAGDWCLGPRAQDAVDSGRALAAALLAGR